VKVMEEICDAGDLTLRLIERQDGEEKGMHKRQCLV
jgi:hypothetical protein